MKAGLAVATVLAAAMGSGQVLANGNELLKHCQSAIAYVDSDGTDGSAFSTGYCFGIINGVSSLRGLTNPSLPKQLQTCLSPDQVVVSQAARIAVKFMTKNPEKLNLDDGIIVLAALQHAYPCK